MGDRGIGSTTRRVFANGHAYHINSVFLLTYIHTYIHTYTRYPYIHTYTHSQLHPCIYACKHACIHVCIASGVDARMRERERASTRVYTAHLKTTTHESEPLQISLNSDCETFISADDLRINLWNLAISDTSFNIVDIKPTNMEELTEVRACVSCVCVCVCV